MKELPDCTYAPWFKDSTPFIEHEGKILETRLEHMQGFLTPLPYFFVRNASSSVAVDAAGWRLRIEGDAVRRPLELSYEEILQMPARTVYAYLECAGNQRAMFELVKGQPTPGNPWKTGGVGNAEWTGAPVAEVLHRAGLQPDAVDTLFVGLDKQSPENGFRRPLPVAKALHPDTLLVYAMNGETLPKDHGFPLRLLVPGWVGSSSVKWLERIVVSRQRLWSRNNTTAYVLVGDAYEPEGQAEGQVATTQTIKSALALPWPAQLPAGVHRLYGYAHSPFGRIAKVEWSSDGGCTWQEASVLDPQIQYSWARFVFSWPAAPGSYNLLTRATDSAGNTQPDDVPLNREGYLFNAPVPHPVIVSEPLAGESHYA